MTPARDFDGKPMEEGQLYVAVSPVVLRKNISDTPVQLSDTHPVLLINASPDARGRVMVLITRDDFVAQPLVPSRLLRRWFG